jgi:ClpP class serine protease
MKVKAKHIGNGFFADLEKFVPLGDYAIDKEYGLRVFGQFLSDIHQLQMGLSSEDVGMKERKRAQLPQLLDMDGSQILRGDNVLEDQSQTPYGSIAHLKLSGVMRSADGWCTRGIDSLVQDFYSAYANVNVIGVLLETDSGGGEGKAGEKLKAAISDRNKPVITHFHEMGSAAVMANLPSDERIASSKMARVGSIGTYVTVDNSVSQWYSRWYTDLYATKSTNKNKAWRAMQEGNLDVLREQIDSYNDGFLEEVQAFLTLKGSRKDIEHTLSGEMFGAEEGKKRGLIDGIGGMRYAIQRLQSYANLPNYQPSNHI